MGAPTKPSSDKYTDKYGAVDTTKWQQDINAMPAPYTQTYQKETRNGTRTRTRTIDPRGQAQMQLNNWQEQNKYKQQTLNQQIMAGASKNENIANTNVNELDTAQSDNVDTAVTSTGKKKKTQGSLSTSLGI